MQRKIVEISHAYTSVTSNLALHYISLTPHGDSNRGHTKARVTSQV